MFVAGGLSTAQARKQRKALLADIASEQKRADRARLAELRQKIRDVQRRRGAARKAAVTNCRAGRVRVKERAAERRAQAYAALRAEREAETLAARSACSARKARVKASALSVGARRRAELAETRALQREIARIDTRNRKKDRALRTTARERLEESDDEVRQNIPADLLPLFERVKRGVKGSSRHSRTEAFLHFAEEHPDEVVEAIEDLSSRELRRLQAEEASLYRELEKEAKNKAKISRPARARARPGREKIVYVEVPF